MHCTKDYGFKIDDIDWSCPVELEPYEKYSVFEQKLTDTYMWTMGVYMANAIATCFNKNNKYPEKPFYSNEDNSAENLQKQRELFAAKLEIMAKNWQLQHQEDTETSNGN